jgi:hypothetical protein
MAIVLWIALPILSWLLGGAGMVIHGKSIEKKVAKCPACGGPTRGTADPAYSRLVISCCKDGCDGVAYYPVRASAVTVFSCNIFVSALCAGALVLEATDTLGWSATTRFILAGVGFIVVAMVVRFLVRLAMFMLIDVGAPLGIQEEIVAHLAPPGWLWTGE